MVRRDLVAVGFLVVGCSMTSLDSLDDNVGSTPNTDSGSGGTGSAGGGSNACVPSCERAVQAGCHGFTQEKCLAACQAKGESIAAECVSAYGALLLCAGETGSYICDGEGNAALVTCTEESAALAACSGASTGGSGGTSGADGGNLDAGACAPGTYLNMTCEDLSTQTADCTDCIVAHCCQQFDTCFADPACAGLYSCAANCFQTQDFSKCITDTCSACTVAADAYNAVNQCAADHCSGQCAGA